MKAAVAKRPVARPAPKPKRIEDVVEVFDEEDYPQGGEAWFDLRKGLVTASCMGAVMADGRDGSEAKTRQTLLWQLAGEILSGHPRETFTSKAMERGIAMEPRAIEHYSFTHDVEVHRVGFVKRTIHNPLGKDLVVGCSPDGLVGPPDRISVGGILQTKTMRPDLMVEFIDRGRFPSEHKWQCHAEMWVLGRPWADLEIYHDGMPYAPTFRFEWSESVIAEMRDQTERFYFDLNQLVARVRARGGR